MRGKIHVRAVIENDDVHGFLKSRAQRHRADVKIILKRFEAVPDKLSAKCDPLTRKIRETSSDDE